MDAPSHDTIDALLAELVPTTRLGEPPGHDLPGPPLGPQPDRQPDRRPPPGLRRGRPRWPLRLALTVLAAGLAAALFAAGMVVGRRTAGGPGGEGAEITGLGSSPGEPFGTASLHSEAGDAAQTDPTGLVARYRDELAARDLDSSGLGDDDLTRFGYAACVFAASSANPADFARFRAAAVADADTTLTDAEVAVVIDTAVAVFCPADAQRLGITA